MRRREFIGSIGALAAGAAVTRTVAMDVRSAGQTPEPWPDPGVPDERYWSFIRGQFPLDPKRGYMNTGGLGASPKVVIDAVKSEMDTLEKISETGHTEELWAEIKGKAARLLGCDPGELAFTRNTTEGINIVAYGLPLQAGDEVITSTQEHVANIFTWLVLQKRTGIVLRFFEPSPVSADENFSRIERLVTSRTRLISIAHALTTTGMILPVKRISELARSKHIWFFVDGAQTAGMFPFNLHEIGCDAYATSGHKWLMGPKETGLLYVREEMLDTIQAKFVGAYSDNGFDVPKGTFALYPGAQRYEYGTVSVPLRVGLGAAFTFIDRIGIERIWERDRALSTYLVDGLLKVPGVTLLTPNDSTIRGAMVTFMHDRVRFDRLQQHLDSYHLRTRDVTEGGLAALRISTHIYNSYEELDRVLEGVRTVKA